MRRGAQMKERGRRGSERRRGREGRGREGRGGRVRGRGGRGGGGRGRGREGSGRGGSRRGGRGGGGRGGGGRGGRGGRVRKRERRGTEKHTIMTTTVTESGQGKAKIVDVWESILICFTSTLLTGPLQFTLFLNNTQWNRWRC